MYSQAPGRESEVFEQARTGHAGGTMGRPSRRPRLRNGSFFRFRQRDGDVPRGPGGPPY